MGESPVPNTSPSVKVLPPPPGTMTFATAIKVVLGGGRCRMLSWSDEGTYICIKSDKLEIYKTEDGNYHPLILSTADMTATDWVEVKKSVEKEVNK